MLYLLDASVLITANNSYYPIDQVPEFWEWLLHQGNMGNVKMPMEMMEEVLEGKNDKDKLIEWLTDGQNNSHCAASGSWRNINRSQQE